MPNVVEFRADAVCVAAGETTISDSASASAVINRAGRVSRWGVADMVVGLSFDGYSCFNRMTMSGT
jgi:hypothetical protein